MEKRRYYPEGFKGKTYSDEYIKKLKEQGVETEFIDTAKIEIKLTRKEQEIAYEQCCDLIMTRTGWVLDNLEHLPEFQVNWQNYGRKRKNNRKLYKESVSE